MRRNRRRKGEQETAEQLTRSDSLKDEYNGGGFGGPGDRENIFSNSELLSVHWGYVISDEPEALSSGEPRGGIVARNKAVKLADGTTLFQVKR